MKKNRTSPGPVSLIDRPIAPPYELGKAEERARIVAILYRFAILSRTIGLTRSARIATDLVALIAPAQ